MARAYQRHSIETNQEANFLEYIIILEIFLVNYSCSLKCIEKNLVNYGYFGNCPRSAIFLLNLVWEIDCQARTDLDSYNRIHQWEVFWTPSLLDLDPNVNPPLPYGEANIFVYAATAT